MEKPLELLQFYLQQEKLERWEITAAPKSYIDIYGHPVRDGESCLLKASPYSHECISQTSAQQWFQNLKQDPETFATLQKQFEETQKASTNSI